MCFYRYLLFLLLAGASLYGAPECFSRNGIAANFIDVRGKWKPGESRVEISERKNGLRFVFHTSVRNGDFKYTKAPHDTPEVVTGSEALELQIVPDPSSGNYFHIGINPGGDLYTARKRDTSWEPAGLKVDAKNWSAVTIDIDYADLGCTKPAPGSVWRINFCHSRVKGNRRDNYSWSGVSNFHDIRNYGTLRFGSPAVPAVILEEQTAVGARARVVYGSGCTLELEEDGKLWPGRFFKDNRWEFSAPGIFELPLKSTAERKFRLKDKNGRILWERSAVSGFNNSAFLEIERYCYAPGDKKLNWKSAFPGVKEFFLSGPRNLKWSSDKNAGSVDLPESEGRYVLTVKSGNCRFSREFYRLPAVPLLRSCEGKWEQKGEFFYCSGRRRFLLGGSYSKVMAPQYGPCFNLGYHPRGRVPGALEFSQLRGKKLRRLPQGTGYLFPGDEKKALEDFRDQALKLKNQPLKISRIAYEAQLKSWLTVKGKLVEKDPAVLYKKLYDEVKKHAPQQIFSLQIDRQEQTRRFAPACDLFEIAVKGSYHVDFLPGIACEMQKVRQLLPGKPIFYWLGVTVPNNYCHTAEEVRAGLFLAFINGSAGAVLHLGHGFLPAERTRLWSVISTTGVELDELMEEFHSHKAAAVESPAGFQTALRDCGRYYLLVAVNISNGPARMKLTLPGKRVFSAGFNSCEARVFRIRK